MRKLLSKKFGNKFFFLFAFVFFATFCNLYAQDVEITADDLGENMTEEDLTNFKTLTERKVKELQNYIITIGDKQTDREIANSAIQAAVKLFHEGALIEVSNKNSNKVTSYMPVEKYFRALRALPYSKVEITFYNVAYISSFQKGPDGKYYATAVIFQEFRGYFKEKLSYVDKTTKQINIVLSQTENPFGGKMWSILLDDIKVQETK